MDYLERTFPCTGEITNSDSVISNVNFGLAMITFTG